MREHTETGVKTAPRSFTLTDEQYARMRDHAALEEVTASALLRRWIAMHTKAKTKTKHLSPWGGNRHMGQRIAESNTARSMMKPFMRMGLCNPAALDYKGDPCELCWPNGTPNALRNSQGNIISWDYTEEAET